MPIEGEKYHLVPFKTGWRVMADNGTFYSQKPLTKKRALAQQRALYAKQKRGEIYHGSGYSCVSHNGQSQIVLKGEGFLGDVMAKVKKVSGAVAERAKQVFKGVRKDYNPPSRAVLQQYGNDVIVAAKIRREPIRSFIQKALDFVTLGKWSEVKKDYPYDKLYHLSLMLTVVTPDGATNDILVEKNAVINISDSYEYNPKQEFFVLSSIPNISLNEFMNNAKNYMGENFFPYDAFKNNCQNFIASVLAANDALTPAAEAFILQPLDGLLKSLPGYTSPLTNVVTNLGGLADVAIYGEGKKVITMEPSDFFKEHKKIVGLLSGISNKLEAEAREQQSEAKAWAKKLKGGAGTPQERLEEIATEMENIEQRIEMLERDLEILEEEGGVPQHNERDANDILTEIAILEDEFANLNEEAQMIESIMAEEAVGSGRCGGICPKFKAYLEARDIDPEDYLKKARAAAKRTGYDARAVEFSDDDVSKLMIYDDKGRVSRFGRVGYGDFIIHSMTGAQSVANSKRQRFRKSHMAMKGDWKSNKFSPNWLAINILW